MHFIEDGYTLEGSIPEKPGVHSALRFKYRPVLAEERSTFRRAALSDQDVANYGKRMVDLIAKHLIEWDALLAGGCEAAVTRPLVAKLHPDLVDGIFDIIMGYVRQEAADVKN